MESSVHSGPVQPPTGTDTSGLSVKGLYLVFTDPVGFFTKLKERHSIVVPYIVILILALLSAYLIKDLMGRYVFSEMQRQAIDSPQMKAAIEQGYVSEAKMAWNIMIFGPIFSLLIPLVGAALALFWGNFVYSGKARFAQILSVMLYANIIYCAGNLLTAVFMRIKDSPSAGFTPAILVADKGLDTPLYTLLSKINPFIIWEIIAVGIGLSILYGFTRNKGYRVSVLSVGLLSILHVVWTAISSLMR